MDLGMKGKVADCSFPAGFMAATKMQRRELPREEEFAPFCFGILFQA